MTVTLSARTRCQWDDEDDKVSLVIGNMNVSYEWFEDLCARLSRDPVAVTKTLEQFRESDVAVDACVHFVGVRTLSHVGMFQAMSILHRAVIVRWTTLSVEKRTEVRGEVTSALMRICGGHVPMFVESKVLQVCASIWKRGWLEISAAEKEPFFKLTEDMMQNPSTSAFATAFLRVIVEEFGQQSFAEINMPFTFHSDVKRAFQKNDLIRVFNLAVQPLQILFSWQQDPASLAPHIPLLGNLFKLLSELISWNFKEDTLNSKIATDDHAMQSNQSNKLPKEWAPQLLHPDFVSHTFGMYQTLTTTAQTFGAANSHALTTCGLELRNLILCLATIDGEIFAGAQEKLNYGNRLLECAVRLVQPSIARSIAEPLAMSDHCTDFESGWERQEQLVLYITLLLSMVSNYKVQGLCGMHQWEPTMLQLGAITLTMSQELSTLAQQAMQYYSQWLSEQSGYTAGPFDKPTETLLMSTWRGEAFSLCLDAWGVILENPTVASANAGIIPTNSAVGSGLNPSFVTWLRNISQQIFAAGFDAMFATLVFETLSGANEEEQEEEELIESRETGDLLVGLCTLGRASFAAAVRHVQSALDASVAELQALAQQPAQVLASSVVQQARCLQALEKCRVCVEFASYLCVENFRTDASQMGKETPIVNDSILFQLVSDPAAAAQLQGLVGCIASVLQWETQLASAQCTGSGPHPLQSPLLLQATYRFFTEYCLRFVDPDPELYSEECLAVAGPLLQSMHGTDINPVIESTLLCAFQNVTAMPLESELASCVSQYLVALSRSHNPARLAFIVGSAPVNSLAQYATALSGVTAVGASSGGGAAGCRLNGTGLAAMFEALGQLFVRSKHSLYFTQLCGAVFALVEGQQEIHARSVFQRVLSALCGIAKCSAGQDSTLYQLFDACWPSQRASIRLYVDADDVLKQYLQLLTLYAEHQISRLPSTSCLVLYQAAYEVLGIYHKRFTLCETRSEQGDAEGVLFRNESCLHILELLNHLSSKEFSFTEDCAEQANQSFEREVSTVLVQGLQLITPLMTAEVLQSFPTTAERYFSFLAFMTSTYVADIARWVNALPPQESQRALGELLGRLQCGSAAVEAAVARQALQALQSLATHQWKCLAGQLPAHSKVPFAANEVLVQVIDSLLQAILSATVAPSAENRTTGAALLSWDRIDSLGNTLVTYIALDTARYTAAAQYLVSLQTPSVQPTLLQALTRLSTARDVDLRAIDRPNRQKFLLNFREFVTQIKSLSLT